MKTWREETYFKKFFFAGPWNENVLRTIKNLTKKYVAIYEMSY